MKRPVGSTVTSRVAVPVSPPPGFVLRAIAPVLWFTVNCEIFPDCLFAVYAKRPDGSIATANGDEPEGAAVPAEFTKESEPLLLILYEFTEFPLNRPTSRNLPRMSAASDRESANAPTPPWIGVNPPVEVFTE